ncbi:DNA polymerase III subunit delta' [Rhodoblastus acidophilus]|uniref:DNA polymerase III subunit delta' n=1 Tax=Rhodoblastus acidophilus TaxID=1074 RepID=UPI000DAC156F|nr:DNA polymerase III subunit delta' [Rhodoblastus acidophilus]RAI24424.1 DNA polymerase III subunit delta' [Rhodoblastus acidophilus]
MRGRQEEAPPESDRFEPAPHPRDTFRLFGHVKAEAALLEAFRSGRMPQAFILGGPQGIGKATLAWRLARFLAVHPDPAAPEVAGAATLDVDPDHPVARKISNLAYGDLALLRRGWNDKTKKHFTRIAVEDVRKMLHLFEQAAGGGGWRMALVDSADDLNAASANALLKMIEEPPPRSLFLLVAHQPGRILPTIRSRCRRLMLHPLDGDDLRAAVRAALDASGIKAGDAELASACARAEGAPREALRLLSAADARFDAQVARTLSLLPRIDWPLVHGIADAAAGDETAFEALLSAAFGWLGAEVRAKRDLGPRAVAPYAEAWERLERDSREQAIFNLDKRAFTLLTFDLLARAAGGGRP